MQELRDADGTLLAILWSAEQCEPGLRFPGDRAASLQVGCFRYPKGKVMRDHAHIPRVRTIEKTHEAVVVLRGSCEARLHAQNLRELVTKLHMGVGDMLIVYNGGVGYTILEDDTIMVEFKAGDYLVKDDSEDRVLVEPLWWDK